MPRGVRPCDAGRLAGPACAGSGLPVAPLGCTGSPPLRDRALPLAPAPGQVLDAPALADDYYLNLVDWSSQNTLAVGLGTCVYLWSACTSKVTRLVDFGEGGAVCRWARGHRGLGGWPGARGPGVEQSRGRLLRGEHLCPRTRHHHSSTYPSIPGPASTPIPRLQRILEPARLVPFDRHRQGRGADMGCNQVQAVSSRCVLAGEGGRG